MLRLLQIDDYGLIAHAEVAFAAGATIFTGETGSGKTMLLGALTFVLGARAGADAVRRGARRAVVSLAFDPEPALLERLTEDGFGVDPGEACSVVREMSESGRSAVRVNGRISTAAYVRGIADGIAEIVGQHEAQRLLSPAYHLELLDRFAGTPGVRAREAVANAYARASEIERELARLQGDERDALAVYEDAVFAEDEIERANPHADEDERLNERRRYLQSIERVSSALRTAHEALSADEGGATGALGAAAAALSHVATLSAELAELSTAGGALQSEANDLAARVGRALEDAAFDPAEADAVNARLETLERLKRRYGGTLRDVFEARERARTARDAYAGRDRDIAALQAQASQTQDELSAAAARLSERRHEAARALEAAMEAELREVALGSGTFAVAVTPQDAIGPQGGERAEFRFAANAGEALAALANVASGGELSRLLLALVVVLAEARSSATALVFDEIDAGIGGATAAAVGARIGRLARAGQVTCVTHLAQIAVWADRQYVLEKSDLRGQTLIGVVEIEDQRGRETEIARMLSGESHDAALRHARALLAGRSARVAVRESGGF